jgi:hypothetical protein
MSHPIPTGSGKSARRASFLATAAKDRPNIESWRVISSLKIMSGLPSAWLQNLRLRLSFSTSAMNGFLSKEKSGAALVAEKFIHALSAEGTTQGVGSLSR